MRVHEEFEILVMWEMKEQGVDREKAKELVKDELIRRSEKGDEEAQEILEGIKGWRGSVQPSSYDGCYGDGTRMNSGSDDRPCYSRPEPYREEDYTDE